MNAKITESQRRATAAFHRRVATVYRSVGRIEDARSAERAASIVERAKAIDREIEAAGGLPEFWRRYERAKRVRGEAHCTRLVDPTTDAVIAELDD